MNALLKTASASALRKAEIGGGRSVVAPLSCRGSQNLEGDDAMTATASCLNWPDQAQLGEAKLYNPRPDRQVLRKLGFRCKWPHGCHAHTRKPRMEQLQ